MKKGVLTAAALAISAVSLASCGGNAEQPAAQTVKGVPGMTISNARMVLAPVAGNPAAVYFDLAYEGDDNLALSRASVKGAKSAMFHDYGEWSGQRQMMDMLPLPIKKGDKLSFAPGGKHIMATGVSPDLKPGGTTEVTITVSGGATQTFSAPIKAAGDER
ncbi:MAG: copper chaperone PCu(A)C [Tsuneonella sp.]